MYYAEGHLKCPPDVRLMEIPEDDRPDITYDDLLKMLLDSGQNEMIVNIVDEALIDERITNWKILDEINRQYDAAGIYPLDKHKEQRVTKVEIKKQPSFGPTFVSPSDVIRHTDNERKIREARRKEAQSELISYITRRDHLKAQLPKLNIANRKDAIKICDINRELSDVENIIEAYQDMFKLAGIKVDTGNPVARKIETVKSTFMSKAKKVFKKAKKFVKRNLDIICGVASVVVPMVVAAVFRKPAPRLA